MTEHEEDKNVNQVLPFLRFIKLTYEQLGPNAEMTEGQFNDIASNVKSMRDLIVG